MIITIDTSSDEWMVFRGHWAAKHGFVPHLRDSSVREAWYWFMAGMSWGGLRQSEAKAATYFHSSPAAANSDAT